MCVCVCIEIREWTKNRHARAHTCICDQFDLVIFTLFIIKLTVKCPFFPFKLFSVHGPERTICRITFLRMWMFTIIQDMGWVLSLISFYLNAEKKIVKTKVLLIPHKISTSPTLISFAPSSHSILARYPSSMHSISTVALSFKIKWHQCGMLN